MKFDIIFTGLGKVRNALKSVSKMKEQTTGIKTNMQAAGKAIEGVGSKTKGAMIATKEMQRQKEILGKTTQKTGDMGRDWNKTNI